MKLLLPTILLLTPFAGAQDLAVSRVAGTGSSFNYYGTSQGKAAYSFATTSCNVGDQVIDWISGTSGRHPVIAQNFFRIYDNRFEQLGQSFLKHGFCAVNEGSCGSCQDTPCSTLGIGCADTYSAGLNDGQGGGAKSDINPTTGDHQHPVTSPTGSTGTLRGRLQVEVAELGIDGAQYIAESQYVSEHDQMAGYVRNNASWRWINTNSVSSPQGVGQTMIGDPAIYAWAAADPDVTVIEVVNQDEGGAGIHGYFFLGYKTTDLLDGRWRYDYAIQNLSSGRAGGSFSIPVPCADVTVTDTFFRDVDYHSGEVYDNTDWTVDTGGGEVRWSSTTTHAQNPDGNALRWGTTYTFGFIADAAPTTNTGELTLYAPGVPASLNFDVASPCGEAPCGILNACAPTPNSYTAAGAQIFTSGTTSVAANDLAFLTSGVPPTESALYFYGSASQDVPFGDGRLCVAPPLHRVLPVLQANIFGEVSLAVDYSQDPFDAGVSAIQPGTSWFFQVWYRDPGAGLSSFNTSSSIKATFCP